MSLFCWCVSISSFLRNGAWELNVLTFCLIGNSFPALYLLDIWLGWNSSWFLVIVFDFGLSYFWRLSLNVWWSIAHLYFREAYSFWRNFSSFKNTTYVSGDLQDLKKQPFFFHNLLKPVLLLCENHFILGRFFSSKDGKNTILCEVWNVLLSPILLIPCLPVEKTKNIPEFSPQYYFQITFQQYLECGVSWAYLQVTGTFILCD